MMSDCQNFKREIVVAENDVGKRFTARLNVDVILRMRRMVCDL